MKDVDLQAIRDLIASHKRRDAAFALLGIFCLAVGVLTLLALFGGMWVNGAERLSLDFLTSFPSRRAGEAGILAAWVGSLLVMLVTAAFAIPLGIAAGVYLEEYAPKNWMTDIIEINVSNLAGIPSIVYGLLGLGMFVYTLGLGRSIFTAGLTLALLILPVVIVATRESIRSIPQMVREASYACGASTWQTVRDHIIPYSAPGILTGVIIGMARAIGETAPLLVVGAVTFIAYLPPVPFTGEPAAGMFDWATGAFTVLPIQMFNWTSRPEAAFQANAAAAGLVLVCMTLLMNATAIWLRYRLRKNIKW